MVKSECRKEKSRVLKKKVYAWKDLMFRNGFLYHKFAISKLKHEDVCPMLDEIRRFQLDVSLLEDFGGGFDEDQDEWDILSDATILQTIRNDSQLKI